MTDRSTKIFNNVPILIIDDIELNHSILTNQLDRYGLKAVCLSSPSQSIAVLRRAREKGITIPIVICDYHMAGMNGLEFVEAVRNDSNIDGTQIIILTTIHLGGLIQKFRVLNVHHILERPCSTEALVAAVQDYVPAAGLLEIPSRRPSNLLPFRDAKSRGLRVLAADDDAANLLVIKGFLNMAGYDVDLVSDGLEAVKAFKDNQDIYDLILMDISMPIMDGVVATRNIRELEIRAGLKPTPIVAVTAHAHSSQRLIYEDAGMDDVITKPMRKRAFDAMMTKWCPLRHSNNILVNG